MNLDAIQTRLKDLVATAPSLTGRPVLLEDKGNLVNELETALQTMSLAVVVALSSGEAKAAQRDRIAWEESFEVVIHRGQLDGQDVPASLTVLQEIRAIVHNAPLDPAARVGNAFTCRRHDLREGGDGSYARVLLIGLTHTVT